MHTHDIVITADESNMLNHQLSFLAGFLSCVPRVKIPAPFRRYVERGFAAMAENNFIPIATLVMGLADETDEDVTKTIELVERLRSYPSMVVPLFFVPLGVLHEKRVFERKQLTAARKDLFVVCAQHTARWSKKFAEWAGGVSEVDKFILYAGCTYIFEALKALKRENQ